MRDIEVQLNGDKEKPVIIYVGKVDADGKYDVLKLSKSEAAVLIYKLKEKKWGL